MSEELTEKEYRQFGFGRGPISDIDNVVDEEDDEVKEQQETKELHKALVEAIGEETVGSLPEGHLEKTLNIVKALDVDEPNRRDSLLIATVIPFLLNVQNRKEGTYGDSWCKRGEFDVFFNVARKFDRLENIVLNGAKDEVGESTIDTIGDFSVYGLLWMTYHLRKNPDAFFDWIADNG